MIYEVIIESHSMLMFGRNETKSVQNSTVIFKLHSVFSLMTQRLASILENEALILGNDAFWVHSRGLDKTV